MALGLLGIAIGPPLFQVYEHLWGEASGAGIGLRIQDQFVLTIPLASMIGVVVAWRKVVHLAHSFWRREDHQEEVVAKGPNLGGWIDIVAVSASDDVGQWTQ
jgi:hypothetical protein